jgi:hypothetical protein
MVLVVEGGDVFDVLSLVSKVDSQCQPPPLSVVVAAPRNASRGANINGTSISFIHWIVKLGRTKDGEDVACRPREIGGVPSSGGYAASPMGTQCEEKTVR